jgi:hypothetical protein
MKNVNVPPSASGIRLYHVEREAKDRLFKLTITLATLDQIMSHHPKNISPKTIPFDISEWCNIPKKSLSTVQGVGVLDSLEDWLVRTPWA